MLRNRPGLDAVSTLTSSAEEPQETAAKPDADLLDGLLWLSLGTAIAIVSWHMDRLQAQHINPYTVPGLVPGLVGLAMMMLGILLAIRGWRVGGRVHLRAPHAAEVGPAAHDQLAHRAVRVRIGTVLALCLTFAVGLVGHGLPFWAAAAIFVTAAVLILRTAQSKVAGPVLWMRTVLIAVVIGLGAGGLITLVFQEIFLVRLP